MQEAKYSNHHCKVWQMYRWDIHKMDSKRDSSTVRGLGFVIRWVRQWRRGQCWGKWQQQQQPRRDTLISVFQWCNTYNIIFSNCSNCNISICTINSNNNNNNNNRKLQLLQPPGRSGTGLSATSSCLSASPTLCLGMACSHWR